jgi:hypothetical protein
MMDGGGIGGGQAEAVLLTPQAADVDQHNPSSTAGRADSKTSALFTAAARGNLSSVRLVLEHG